jgi:hypothetical protein
MYTVIRLNSNLQETLDEHALTRTKGDAPRDFIDVYVDEMDEQSQKNSNSTFSSKFFLQFVWFMYSLVIVVN